MGIVFFITIPKKAGYLYPWEKDLEMLKKDNYINPRDSWNDIKLKRSPTDSFLSENLFRLTFQITLPY